MDKVAKLSGAHSAECAPESLATLSIISDYTDGTVHHTTTHCSNIGAGTVDVVQNILKGL